MKNLLAKMFFLLLLAHWHKKESPMRNQCKYCGEPVPASNPKLLAWYCDNNHRLFYIRQGPRIAAARPRQLELPLTMNGTRVLEGDPGDETSYDPVYKLDLE